MKSMPKKRRRVLALCLALLVSVPVLYYALGHVGIRPPSAKADGRFLGEVNAQACWDNTMEGRIPQTAIYDVMAKHMEGENARLLFIGCDGALASAAGLQAGWPGSAIGDLAAQGGLWLGQAGGAVPGDQVTRTAPSWTSAFTGMWAEEHQVFDNGDTLAPGVRTILYQLREQGRGVSFSFSWEPHGTQTYRLEAAGFPEVFRYCRNDAGTLISMREAIEAGQHAVFGTFEYVDHAGHLTGYAARSPFYQKAMGKAEAAAAELIAAARAREIQYGEDWLILIVSDHGGYGFDHFGSSLMESTTFFAANKKIF